LLPQRSLSRQTDLRASGAGGFQFAFYNYMVIRNINLIIK